MWWAGLGVGCDVQSVGLGWSENSAAGGEPVLSAGAPSQPPQLTGPLHPPHVTPECVTCHNALPGTSWPIGQRSITPAGLDLFLEPQVLLSKNMNAS